MKKAIFGGTKKETGYYLLSEILSEKIEEAVNKKVSYKGGRVFVMGAPHNKNGGCEKQPPFRVLSFKKL